MLLLLLRGKGNRYNKPSYILSAKIQCAFVLKLPQSPTCLWENISNQSNYAQIFIIIIFWQTVMWTITNFFFLKVKSSVTYLCTSSLQVFFLLLLFWVVLKHHYLLNFSKEIPAYSCAWNLSNDIKWIKDFVVNPSLKTVI